MDSAAPLPMPARDRLLQAGAELFAELGFAAAGTRAIAARAGVPQGLVRHHFASKAGLFEAVLCHGVEQLERDLRGAGPPTVDGVLALLARHALLLRIALHALLAAGDQAASVREGLRPLLGRAVELQRAADPVGAELELRAALWSAAAVAAVLLPPSSSRAAGDALFAWLCAPKPPSAAGAFSATASRARLRG